jgi:hypothetical protein
MVDGVAVKLLTLAALGVGLTTVTLTDCGVPTPPGPVHNSV